MMSQLQWWVTTNVILINLKIVANFSWKTQPLEIISWTRYLTKKLVKSPYSQRDFSLKIVSNIFLLFSLKNCPCFFSTFRFQIIKKLPISQMFHSIKKIILFLIKISALFNMAEYIIFIFFLSLYVERHGFLRITHGYIMDYIIVE